MESKLTLADFIARRRRELDEEEAELRKKLEAIAVEREHLNAAEQVSFGNKTPDREITRAIRKRQRGIKSGTIMAKVLNILRDNIDGLTANDILLAYNRHRENNFLIRESLSPQLSRLKQAGFLEFENGLWKLAVDQQRESE